MSITEAFDGVIPAQPASPAPSQTTARRRPSPRPRPAADTQTPHLHAVTDEVRARPTRASRVRRLVRVVYTDAADSWIAEERSPSAKTVWRTDHTAHLDELWKPYGMWAKAYRPAAVTVALLLDAIKFLLVHPLRGPLTTAVTALLILLATQ